MSDPFAPLGRPLKGFDSLQGIERNRIPRPPRMEGFSVRSRGPAHLRIGQEIRAGVGPGEPPPGFVTATTSVDEWYVYWAIAKILQDPLKIEYPYWGGLMWGYQKNISGGQNSVVDFVIWDTRATGGDEVGIRVQSERYHVFADPRVKAYDMMQRARLNGNIRVVDIYSQDFLGDPTGAAVIRVIKEALSQRERGNPISSGLGRRVKR